jgi:hypothetical protein
MAQMAERNVRTDTREVSGWAVGGTIFAGVIMLMIGAFHAIAGLVAILDDQFYVVARNYTYSFDVTGWGWIHLIGGGLVVLGGAYVLGSHVGSHSRHHAGRAERARQLLLRPVLPVVVAPHHRAGRVGGMVAEPPCRRAGLRSPLVELPVELRP